MVRLKVVISAALLAGIILAQAGRAQTPTTISVVQGNGQVICDGCPNTGLAFFDPMIVKVADASGNPVANAQVTWSLIKTTAQAAGTVAPTTVTGSSASSSAVDCNYYNTNVLERIGETCNIFNLGTPATPLVGYIVNTIQASISNGQSVTFTLIQSPRQAEGSANTGSLQAQIAPDSALQIGATISGAVGSVSTTAIKVQVRSLGGTPIPGVSVRLIPQSVGQGGATIACQSPAASTTVDPGSVLTLGDGTALCYPVFTAAGSTPMNFDILVGGVNALVNPSSVNSNNQGLGLPAASLGQFFFRATATPNTPASLQAVSGNNQSGNPGAVLGQPLVVQVLDSSGHALTGVTVNWAVSPSNAATITPTSGPSDSNGKAQTSVTLAGSITGMVTVTATAGSLSQPFSITVTAVTPTVTSLTKVSGDTQSALQGMVFGTPLAVMASSASGPVSNVPVQFTITGGSGSLSASGGSVTQSVVVPTLSNGQASVTATAGSTPGTLTVTASASGFSQTFTLTVVQPQPPINTSSFLNGAGFFATVPSTAASPETNKALSPCGVATLVVGSPLAPAAYPLTPNMYATPVEPANISISFLPLGAATPPVNAPILNLATASTGQQLITFQVPCEIGPGWPTVTVSINGSTTMVPAVEMRPGAPGIFETLGSDGVRRAIAVRQDGSFVSVANPARRGEFIRVYITGAGPVFPLLATPSPALPQPGIDSTIVDPNQVVVGLATTAFYGAGAVTVRAAPNLIGVYEVAFMVPSSNVQPGDNLLVLGVMAEGNPKAFSQVSKLPIQ